VLIKFYKNIIVKEIKIMFLSEGYVSANEEVSADPVYAMQIMQEATDDWNDICMKMIKLEHTAIMQEDAELLAEGAKEALHRFKNNIIVFGKKFIEFLERVRVQWSKIQASIATKWLNPDKVKAIYESVKYNQKAKITLPAEYNDMVKLVDKMSGVINDITDHIAKTVKKAFTSGSILGKEVNKEMNGTSLKGYDESTSEGIARILRNNSFEEFSKEKDTQITDKVVTTAINFLKKRPVAIKNIEVMKKAVTQIQNVLISEMDKNDKPQAKNDLVVLQSAFNKVIIKINKMTTYAIKICTAATAVSKDTGVTARDRNRGADNYRNMKGAWVDKPQGKTKALKESVLDMFE
jgi:hypothetical protein